MLSSRLAFAGKANIRWRPLGGVLLQKLKHLFKQDASLILPLTLQLTHYTTICFKTQIFFAVSA
jgi:hypothetical protein